MRPRRSRRRDHPVGRARGVEFLIRSAAARMGSWPIDTNLATWVTTLSVNALAAGGLTDAMDATERRGGSRLALFGQQYRTEHRTRSPSRGVGVDRPPGRRAGRRRHAGALLALRELPQHDPAPQVSSDGERTGRVAPAGWPGPSPTRSPSFGGAAGIEWRLKLQNADGGIPTFCRDGASYRSTGQRGLTAHALRAFRAWQPYLPSALQARVDATRRAAIGYLIRTHARRAWVPLWFGDQYGPAR